MNRVLPGALPPLILLIGAAAFESLRPPIAIHLALDIPVFYGKVCLGT